MPPDDTEWDYPMIDRGDGRVEVMCPHGVGHPERSLSTPFWLSWMGVHGCDGCCSQDSYQLAILKKKGGSSENV